MRSHLFSARRCVMCVINVIPERSHRREMVPSRPRIAGEVRGNSRPIKDSLFRLSELSQPQAAK